MRDMVQVMEQIQAREPLFHHRELVYYAETFDRETSDDFWEVSASGQCTHVTELAMRFSMVRSRALTTQASGLWR